MQGFSQNRDQPIQIESATLEMRDKKRKRPSPQCEGGAGRHHHDVQDAGGILRIGFNRHGAGSRFEDRRQTGPDPVRDPGPGGTSSIKRLEARGNVVVTRRIRS